MQGGRILQRIWRDYDQQHIFKSGHGAGPWRQSVEDVDNASQIRSVEIDGKKEGDQFPVEVGSVMCRVFEAATHTVPVVASLCE